MGDYFGIIRSDPVTDIGAHEYQSSSVTPTITQQISSSLSPTIPSSPICLLKKQGDSDCKTDGSGKSINFADFEIWRKEYFGSCTSSNATASACQADDDQDGSLIDANFDSDSAVTIADFEIWRKGYFSI